MATRTYAAFYGDDDNFDIPHPTLADLNRNFGVAVAHDNAHLIGYISSHREESPTALALMLNGDRNHIHIVHRPTFVRVGATTGRTVALLGNQEDALDFIILHNDLFERLPPKVVRTATDTAALLGAGADFAPELAVGDPGAIAAIRACRAIVLPSPWIANAITRLQYTHLEFYQEHLEPALTGGDAATIAALQPWVDWWNYTC